MIGSRLCLIGPNHAVGPDTNRITRAGMIALELRASSADWLYGLRRFCCSTSAININDALVGKIDFDFLWSFGFQC